MPDKMRVSTQCKCPTIKERRRRTPWRGHEPCGLGCEVGGSLSPSWTQHPSSLAGPEQLSVTKPFCFRKLPPFCDDGVAWSHFAPW